MIAVNNWRDSVSLPPLAAKPKKGKSQTVTSTLPKSQGPEASESLSKKSKIPKDIQLASTRLPFTLDEGTHKLQSLLESTATHHKDSGGNKQPLDRDITSMTPDEGTAKTTLCPEASLRDKDLGGNIPPTDMEPIHNLVVILQGLVLNIRSNQTKEKDPRCQRLDDIHEKNYERLKKILEELGIQSALPASVPEQVSSQTS
nr:hypothetical protein [Tanacetum cinerariifolium]